MRVLYIIIIQEKRPRACVCACNIIVFYTHSGTWTEVQQRTHGPSSVRGFIFNVFVISRYLRAPTAFSLASDGRDTGNEIVEVTDVRSCVYIINIYTYIYIGVHTERGTWPFFFFFLFVRFFVIIIIIAAIPTWLGSRRRETAPVLNNNTITVIYPNQSRVNVTVVEWKTLPYFFYTNTISFSLLKYVFIVVLLFVLEIHCSSRKWI